MFVFSKTLSYLFHPLLMPTLAIYILFSADTYLKFSTTPEMRNAVYLMIFVSTFLFPVLISIFLYKSKQIKNLLMETTDERILPLLTTLIFYLTAFFLLKKTGISYMIYTSFLAATLTVFLVFLNYVLLKWKISAHMAGIGGVIGAIIAFSIKLSTNMVFTLMICILIAGLLGYARLRLQAHTPAQVYTGFGIGVITQLLLVL